MSSTGGVLLQAPPRRLFRANAFQYPPGLVQRIGSGQNILNLIAAGERPSVQKDDASRILPQQIRRSLKHDLNAEIVLLRRVFNLRRSKNRMANFVLTEEAAGGSPSQFARKGCLTGAGKPGHQHDHGPLKHDSQHDPPYHDPLADHQTGTSGRPTCESRRVADSSIR